jgi:GNAT superfamily N-acetyltransferase
VTISLRAATAGELRHLAALEVEAGQLFASIGLDEVAAHVPDLAALRDHHEKGRVWVAEEDGQIAGYIVGEVLDGNAHIEQVSVSPSYAGRGIGATLVRHVESWGRSLGLPATTLTTFRDVPWNAPYYARLGYLELTVGRRGPELTATMEHEASMPGIDATRRCAMVRPNSAVGRPGPPPPT